MDYNFIDSNISLDDINLPNSKCINNFILKNNHSEIIKILDFLSSDKQLLHIHGFLGSGKRQIINYASEFLSKDVIKLEYYCKAATVCDDIVLYFINKIEKLIKYKNLNINAKISSILIQITQLISNSNVPFVIVLHSFDDIAEQNQELVISFIQSLNKFNNVKVIISTKSLTLDSLINLDFEKRINIKSFNKDIFKEFVDSFKIKYSPKILEDFYKYTRGYYYYTALSLKIMNSMEIDLSEFLTKYAQSGMKYDMFLGHTYINLIPKTIRNFFWFLRTIRHGISLNALAVLELYDDFAIEYLKTNLMVFVSDENIYVQDFFLQDIDISIPINTQIKLHKYIISIYEKQVKENMQEREIFISRQALRAEIEYHTKEIESIQSTGKNNNITQIVSANHKQSNEDLKIQENNYIKKSKSLNETFSNAKKLAEDNKNTEAIDAYSSLLEEKEVDFTTFIEIRIELARLYKKINKYKLAQHYYEIAEQKYIKRNEVISLNYLYYELTDLYNLMYKTDKAINTIKKVIYSVDTPQSLMVDSCTLLGNIYASNNSPDEAYSYYRKALESIDNNASIETIAELYFRYALSLDDKGETDTALEYYSKCTDIKDNKNSYRALALSNMASCYFEKNNTDKAKELFMEAYDIEKHNNNYDGIYYTASNIANILMEKKDDKAINYLEEAKQSAEFLNENFYMMEAYLALGDYYYNNISMNKKALVEYFKARKIATSIGETINLNKINQRIEDMELRMDKDVFKEIESKYE